MIAELFGLPGSGKSTLAGILAERHNFAVIKIKNKAELVFLNFVYFIKHPIRFFATLFCLVKNSDSWPAFYYKFTNTFLHHNAKYQKALKAGKAVLDQGYLQNLLSVFDRPISEDFLKRYARRLLLPDKLIILDLPFSETQRRLETRGYILRQNFGRQARQKWTEAIKSNYDLFLKNISQLSLDYSVIDARQSVDGVVRDTLNFLK